MVMRVMLTSAKIVYLNLLSLRNNIEMNLVGRKTCIQGLHRRSLQNGSTALHFYYSFTTCYLLLITIVHPAQDGTIHHVES
jgi:hypothetical protein